MRFLPRAVMAIALAATALVVVGAIAPWAVIKGTSISHAGIDGNVGWTTVGLAVGAFVMLAIAHARRIGWLALTAAIPAGTAAGLACYYARDPSAFLKNPGTDIATRGWGMTLDIVAGVVLTACCVVVALQCHRGKMTQGAGANRGIARNA